MRLQQQRDCLICLILRCKNISIYVTFSRLYSANVLERYILWPGECTSVRPAVCDSVRHNVGIVSKLPNILSRNVRRMVADGL